MKKAIQLCLRCDNGDTKANKKNKHRGTFREDEVPHHAGKDKILICHEPVKTLIAFLSFLKEESKNSFCLFHYHAFSF